MDARVINADALIAAVNDAELEIETLSEARRTANILLDVMWDDYKSCCETGVNMKYSQVEDIHDALNLVLKAYYDAENNLRKQIADALCALGYEGSAT